MRALVVGAGAWGAPCAARLASAAGVRSVTLIDATGVGAKKMASGSSSGPTRIYRLAHSDRARVRLAVRALDSWKRWSRESGVELLGARGLLWRSDADRVAAVAAALTAEHIPHTPVPAADVARFMPGLAPDGRPATWHPDAGFVWAAKALEAYMHAFARAGGELLTGPASRVTSLTLRPSGDGVVAALAGGGEVTADVAVLAPGAGAGTLINGFLAQPGADGHDIRSLAFTPRLQLTAHFRERSCGAPAPTADATDAHPCFIDGAPAHDPTMIMYAMPTPGIGYKAGLDAAVDSALGPAAWADPAPPVDAGALATLVDRVTACLPGLHPAPVDAAVCTWTDSPDGRFVVGDASGDGRIIVAAGCGGEGFKFSPLVGDVLAGMARGRQAGGDDDDAVWAPARFAGGAGVVRAARVLGD